jgi:hypothetical protein
MESVDILRLLLLLPGDILELGTPTTKGCPREKDVEAEEDHA